MVELKALLIIFIKNQIGNKVIEEKVIFKMAKSIAKELCVLDRKLSSTQACQLSIVLKDNLQNWSNMTQEKAYEDIYKTIYCLIELWRNKEI